VGVAALLQHQIEALEQQQGIGLGRSRWLFALAARLEKPIHADVGASFRSLYKRCVGWRARLSSAHDPLLPILNVLVAVAGAYFKQDELLAAMVQHLEPELS
jgi:survival of motor neuron protein-interacting protein 1